MPAAVVRPGLPVRLARRPIRVDVARAAETYAIVDSEACGVPLDRDHVPELVAAGKAVYESRCVICHGPNGDGKGLMGIIHRAQTNSYNFV